MKIKSLSNFELTVDYSYKKMIRCLSFTLGRCIKKGRIFHELYYYQQGKKQISLNKRCIFGYSKFDQLAA